MWLGPLEPFLQRMLETTYESANTDAAKSLRLIKTQWLAVAEVLTYE